MAGSFRDAARPAPRRSPRARPRRQLGEVEDIPVEVEAGEEFTNATTDAQAQRKLAFLACMKRTRGAVMQSCEEANISYRTLCRWRKDDLAFKSEFDVADYAQFDYVQNKLMDKIGEGDVRAITFYLKTKGAKHGYSEKVEISGDIAHVISHTDHEEQVSGDALANIIGRIVTHEDEFDSVEQ